MISLIGLLKSVHALMAFITFKFPDSREYKKAIDVLNKAMNIGTRHFDYNTVEEDKIINIPDSDNAPIVESLLRKNNITFTIDEGVRKAGNGFSVTRRPLPGDKDVFTYHELAKDMWRDIMKQAQKHYDIHFDLENNDPSSKEKARLIRISRPSDEKVQRGEKQPEDVFAVRCQIWHAGGDWELPVIYFKCQLQENSFYGLGSMKIYLGDLGMYRNSHWIMIPPFKAGNYNLVPNDKDDSFRAMHNDEENREYNSKELDNTKAWEWLQSQFMQMVADHCMGKNRQSEKGVSAMDRISWDDYNVSLLRSASDVEATDLDKNFKKIRSMLKPELSKQEIGAINKELDIIYRRYRALERK